MAYRFIDENHREFGLRWLLARMDLHPNAYYNYLRQNKKEYLQEKTAVCKEISAIYHELGGIIGHRAMQVFLARKGIFRSKNTIHRYMNKELHLYCICRRKRPGYRKGHVHRVFPNLVNRDFQAAQPNLIWCTDFTYLFLSNGTPRYNCTIIDLYDRSVVASANSRWMTSELAIEAVKKALTASGCEASELILHSDQGCQFTSFEFSQFCQNHGITQSMSHAGCPYDNAPMERYYNTLKNELIYQYRFETADEMDYAVSEYAYNWYNQVRPHSYDGYLTPFEKRFGFA